MISYINDHRQRENSLQSAQPMGKSGIGQTR